MKFSIAVSILILAVGGAMGLLHQKRLTTLRDDHRQLAARAGTLGISAAAEEPEERVTKRPREDRGGNAGSLTAELIALGKEMELQEKAGDGQDEVLAKKSAEMQLRLLELDAAQMKALITGLRDDTTLTDEFKRNLISGSIMMLSEDHPAAALALVAESAGLLDDSMLGDVLISSSLGRWAKDDPLAALEWLRKNAAAHPDLADEDAKRFVLGGAAENDPKLAFKLMAGMHLEDTSAAIESVVETGKTPEQRSAILDALRAHLATLPAGDERDELLHESLESMGRNLADESFDSVASWISTAKLSPEESAKFAAGLSWFNTKQDTGRWIDWMAGNLPKEEIAENVDNLVGQWTQQDYLAAGKWLSAAADGPAKQAAISTYAGTVAEYEPQTAVQWALTLSPGDERQATFETIYRNWPKRDAAAANAFAKEHGVDTEAEE